MIRFGTQLILGVLEVNGLATLASASDSEIPAWAALRAWRRREGGGGGARKGREGGERGRGEREGEGGRINDVLDYTVVTHSTIVSPISTHNYTITREREGVRGGGCGFIIVLTQSPLVQLPAVPSGQGTCEQTLYHSLAAATMNKTM